MDTIFALSTVPGRGAIAVIRISGPQANEVLLAFCGKLPAPREATVSQIQDPLDGRIIDQGLVLYFEEGSSYTGEAMAEFQVHGGIGVVDDLLDSLASSGLCRPAERGEFTRRALENNRIDLLQAEGIGDLIAADTREQIRMANGMLNGTMSHRIEAWREELIVAAALAEATLDFADEEVPQDVGPEVKERLERVLGSLTSELDGYRYNERVREGFEVAIVGAPNVGKSTLLNYIAGREVAITSDIHGTTRDVIEVQIDLGGLPVLFLDTAGIRETTDRVEAIGISNTQERARVADLRVILDDGSGLDGFSARPDDIVVNSKADVSARPNVLNISSRTGVGIEELLDRVQLSLKKRVSPSALISRQRHKLAVEKARSWVEFSLVGVGDDLAPEVLSEHIKDANRALESLIGKVGVEDLLDRIFSTFCIGK